jgi:hypothetical protein
MVYIVSQHQRQIHALISQKIPKSALTESYSSDLFKEILRRILHLVNPLGAEPSVVLENEDL